MREIVTGRCGSVPYEGNRDGKPVPYDKINNTIKENKKWEILF